MTFDEDTVGKSISNLKRKPTPVETFLYYSIIAPAYFILCVKIATVFDTNSRQDEQNNIKLQVNMCVDWLHRRAVLIESVIGYL